MQLKKTYLYFNGILWVFFSNNSLPGQSVCEVVIVSVLDFSYGQHRTEEPIHGCLQVVMMVVVMIQEVVTPVVVVMMILSVNPIILILHLAT